MISKIMSIMLMPTDMSIAENTPTPASQSGELRMYSRAAAPGRYCRDMTEATYAAA